MTPQNVAPDCTNESPSPRILRQLTRSEYGRTLEDLLALRNPDITAIPPDQQMRGFTNNVAVSFVDEQHLDAFSTVGAALAAKALQTAYDKLVPCTTLFRPAGIAVTPSIGSASGNPFAVAGIL